MKVINKIFFLFTFLIGFEIMLNAQQKEVVGYFAGGGMKDYHYTVKNIIKSGSADILTVINYAFSQPRPDSSGRIVPVINQPDLAYQKICDAEHSVDGIADDSTQALRGNFNQLKKLKALYPKMKILMSIGGWGGCTYFSDAAMTEESREVFVDSCMSLFIKGNLPVVKGAGGKGAAAGVFDGIDIDWEYPVANGPEGMHFNPKDNDNLSKLFKLFRKRLDSIRPGLLLTAALPAQEINVRNFNVTEDSKVLDWYTLMTYDMYGGGDSSTGHHTNLFAAANEPAVHPGFYSLVNTVKLFHEKYGVSYEKLLPGVAFYGRGWHGVNPENNGLFQGSEVKTAGFNNYNNLMKLRGKGYKEYFDNSAMAPWLFNSEKKIFWTFDNAQSVALKSRYVEEHGLRGLMFWELSGDDSSGTLIHAISTMEMPDVSINPTNKVNKKISIQITKPDNGDYYIEGSDIKIYTNIPENDSSIVRVEYFVDDKSIGYVANGFYDWAWFNVKEGKHIINVIGLDKDGNKIESKPVMIFVNPIDECSTVWQSGNDYRKGEQIIFDGKIFVCVKNIDKSNSNKNPGIETQYWRVLKGIE